MKQAGQNSERRLCYRVPSHIQMKAFHGHSVYFGTVRNYSANGLKIVTKHLSLPLYSKIEIHIPTHKDFLKLNGKILWESETDDSEKCQGILLTEKPDNYVVAMCLLTNNRQFNAFSSLLL